MDFYLVVIASELVAVANVEGSPVKRNLAADPEIVQAHIVAGTSRVRHLDKRERERKVKKKK